MARQLPAYFKEYLDERFAHVVSKITEVKKDVGELGKEMKKMNGSVATLQLKVGGIKVKNRNARIKNKKTRKTVARNQKYILAILATIFVFGIVFLKENDNFSVATIVSLFSGL